jgi:hypothetical protein
MNVLGPSRVGLVSKEAIMDKEHVKGAADKAKGAVKPPLKLGIARVRKVVAERLVAHLEASGFVIMRKPIRAFGAGDNPGRRGFER